MPYVLLIIIWLYIYLDPCLLILLQTRLWYASIPSAPLCQPACSTSYTQWQHPRSDIADLPYHNVTQIYGPADSAATFDTMKLKSQSKSLVHSLPVTLLLQKKKKWNEVFSYRIVSREHQLFRCIRFPWWRCRTATFPCSSYIQQFSVEAHRRLN